MRLGLVGATGQVGGVLLTCLEERDLAVSQLRLFATPASAGRVLRFRGEELVVESIEDAELSQMDVVFLCCGAEAARAIALSIAATSAIVIDNSSAFRGDVDVPLVVSEVNPQALDRIPRGIVANPNCTTMVAMPVIAPLHRAAGLRRIVVATYQAASGAGRAGVAELTSSLEAVRAAARGLTFGNEAVAEGQATVFPGPLAANVLPLAGSFAPDGSGETTEEQKWRDEARKILEAPRLAVSATCVRVPVFTGHAMACNLEFERPLSVDQATALLESAPGVELAELPTPRSCVGRDLTVVGRLRVDPSVPHGLSLFLAGDNLRKGAALNAVQLAELLGARTAP